jgi:putative thioredoxin
LANDGRNGKNVAAQFASPAPVEKRSDQSEHLPRAAASFTPAPAALRCRFVALETRAGASSRQSTRQRAKGKKGMDRERVFDVGDSDFEARVIERSKSVPVVVDFWADWCGPCRVLGPVLERLVAENDGEVELAKVDIDRSPGLAAAFGVRSIPMVVGFRDGHVAASFVGALPEQGVREFLARLLPSPAEKLSARADETMRAGQVAAAEEMYRQARHLDPRCDAAALGLAGILAQRGDDQQALDLLATIDPGTPLRPDADRLAACIRIGEAGTADEATLRAKLEADANDHESRFTLAQSLAAREHYKEALEHYLEIVRRDRDFRDDGARKAMLDIFDLLGPEQELVQYFRSELAKVLFR